MAPSRPLINSKFRSMSEPNLPECLLREQQSEQSPDLDLSFINADEHSSRDNVVPLQSFSQLPHELMPVDKEKNIKNFLASLPSLQTIEDDQGIGENTYTSESGSGSSSPILTPTDDEQFNIKRHKLVKEIKDEKSSRARHSKLDDVDMGSSPTELSTGYYSQTSSSQVLEKPPSMSQSYINIPPKPAPPATLRSTKSKVSTTPPGSSSITTPMVAQLRQPIALSSQLPYKIIPRAALMAGKATSMPHNLALAHNLCSFPLPPKLLTISTESSKTSLSSMALPETEVDVEEERDDPVEDSIMITVTKSKDNLRDIVEDSSVDALELPSTTRVQEGHARQSSDGAIMTVSASSSRETMTSDTGNQHRRAKSDGESISGPTQIPSVPDRVKEIEEMNVVHNIMEGSSYTNTGVAHSPGGISTSITENSEDKQQSDSSTSTSDDKLQSIGTMSRTSSEHSLSSCSRDIELEELAHYSVASCSPLLIRSTRHGSLSPNPPSLQMKIVTEQTRCTSLMFLPQSEQEQQQQREGELNDTNLASTLMGAVKARVQDIEEKNKDYAGSGRSKSTLEKGDGVTKVSPPSTHTPLSNVMAGSIDATEGEAEIEALVTLRQHSTTSQVRPSSEVLVKDDSSLPNVSQPRMERRESTPPALFTAWSQWMPADGIPTKPVQDLKQKFEDSTKESKTFSKSTEARPQVRAVDSLKVGSNLRRSQSLKVVGSPTGKSVERRRRKNPSCDESPSFTPISDSCSQD